MAGGAPGLNRDLSRRSNNREGNWRPDFSCTDRPEIRDRPPRSTNPSVVKTMLYCLSADWDQRWYIKQQLPLQAGIAKS